MFKVAWNITKKIFGVLFMILSPLKRLWCGLRRKRRNSDSLLPMTNHYPSVENLSLSQNGSGQLQEELSPWDSWEDQNNKIRSVQQYRQHQQQVLQQQHSVEGEQEQDYFQDMTPKLKKQKKVLIKKADDHHQINSSAISSKLAVSTDIPLMESSELGAWEDTSNAWEGEADEDLTWEADNVIREKRKAERQQKLLQNQRKKMERDQQKPTKSVTQGHLNAVRLSS